MKIMYVFFNRDLESTKKRIKQFYDSKSYSSGGRRNTNSGNTPISIAYNEKQQNILVGHISPPPPPCPLHGAYTVGRIQQHNRCRAPPHYLLIISSVLAKANIVSCMHGSVVHSWHIARAPSPSVRTEKCPHGTVYFTGERERVRSRWSGPWMTLAVTAHNNWGKCLFCALARTYIHFLTFRQLLPLPLRLPRLVHLRYRRTASVFKYGGPNTYVQYIEVSSFVYKELP